MENFTETVCRLCLNIISDGIFKVIEENIRELLRVLLNMSAEEEDIKPVICPTCSLRLFEVHHFKTTCMDTEHNIFSHVNSENKTPVDLREIYLNEVGKEYLGTVMEDEQICRLCMHVVTSGFTSVQDVASDVFQTCIPEINFSSTKEPVICATCLNSLNAHSRFLKKCLEADKQIKKSCNNRGERPLYIKSEEIDGKDDGNSDAAFHSDESVKDINQYNNTSQCSTRMDFLYDSTNDTEEKHISISHDKIEHKDNIELDHFEQMNSLQVPKYKYRQVPLYECDSCDFKVKRRDNLTKHQLRHKSSSEVRTYDCGICDYKTKYKCNLSKHQLTHKDSSEIRMYTCGTCDFKTKYKDYLSRHQMIHKGSAEIQMYKCELCDFKTKWKSYIAQHQLGHSIPKVQHYECDLCDYKASYKNVLLKHQLKHKGPFGVADVKL